MLFTTCFVNNRYRQTVKCIRTYGPFSTMQRKYLKNDNTRNTYKMSNDNLAIYTGRDGQYLCYIELKYIGLITSEYFDI